MFDNVDARRLLSGWNLKDERCFLVETVLSSRHVQIFDFMREKFYSRNEWRAGAVGVDENTIGIVDRKTPAVDTVTIPFLRFVIDVEI